MYKYHKSRFCKVCTGDELEKRHEILNRLFHGNMDMEKPAFIEPPFTADYVRPRLLSSAIFLLYTMGLQQDYLTTSGCLLSSLCLLAGLQHHHGLRLLHEFQLLLPGLCSHQDRQGCALLCQPSSLELEAAGTCRSTLCVFSL